MQIKDTTNRCRLIAIMLGRLEMDVDEFGKTESRFDSKKLESAIQEVITSHGASPTDLFNDQVDRGCRV